MSLILNNFLHRSKYFWSLYFSVPLILLMPALHGEASLSPADKDVLIEDIHQRVRDLNSRMKKMGAVNLPAVRPKKRITAPAVLENSHSTDFIKARKEESVEEASIRPEVNPGFYFLPFVGLSVPQDIDWKLEGALQEASVQCDNGISAGLRLGYRWRYFYLEERISHSQFSFDSVSLPGSSFPVVGESNTLSFQQSLGFTFYINDWAGIEIGGGVGIANQENSVSQVNGSSYLSEKDSEWIFSYDALIGLYFTPFKYFRAGLNYRWARTAGTDAFSEIDTHLIECSLGAKF